MERRLSSQVRPERDVRISGNIADKLSVELRDEHGRRRVCQRFLESIAKCFQRRGCGRREGASEREQLSLIADSRRSHAGLHARIVATPPSSSPRCFMPGYHRHSARTEVETALSVVLVASSRFVFSIPLLRRILHVQPAGRCLSTFAPRAGLQVLAADGAVRVNRSAGRGAHRLAPASRASSCSSRRRGHSSCSSCLRGRGQCPGIMICAVDVPAPMIHAPPSLLLSGSPNDCAVPNGTATVVCDRVVSLSAPPTL